VTNIRSMLGAREPYWSFCREERNLAAIFYHLLLSGDNLKRFCQAVDYRPCLSDPAVYFEYAMLRDLWFSMGGTHKGSDDLQYANARKRQIIIKLLRPSAADELASCSVTEFNHHFGSGPKASTWCIQSPSTWSLGNFRKTIPDPGEFLRTCMFKWAFNAKPDIVIHADLDHALCIEAKVESGEGQYPASPAEKLIFDELGLKRVTQTQLQRYLMEDLLGIGTEFLFLLPEVTTHVTEHRMVTWAFAFGALEMEEPPSILNAWVRNVLGQVEENLPMA